MDHRKERGRNGETAAAAFLEKQGVRILLCNYRCPFGEIDLIGKEGETFLMIEVKMRNGRTQGYPCEAVNQQKQRKICRTYDHFRMKYQIIRVTYVTRNGWPLPDGYGKQGSLAQSKPTHK